MQRISVDLPEPDGPQMTIRSPLQTVEVDVLQHVELAVPLVHAAHASIIASAADAGSPAASVCAVVAMVTALPSLSALVAGVQPALEVAWL